MVIGRDVDKFCRVDEEGRVRGGMIGAVGKHEL